MTSSVPPLPSDSDALKGITQPAEGKTTGGIEGPLAALSSSERQDLSFMAVVLHALLGAFQVGGEGLIARNSGLSTINNYMMQLSVNISKESINTKMPTTTSSDPKAGEIESINSENREIMRKQMVANLRIGQLQQAAQQEDAQVSSAFQELSAVVRQFTFTLSVMKGATFDAALTKPTRD